MSVHGILSPQFLLLDAKSQYLSYEASALPAMAFQQLSWAHRPYYFQIIPS